MNSATLKNDFLASIVVFLVAVPLCLGIALASGAPLFGGLLTGVIGGIVVGAISGSALSVSGPAAGMIAVIVASIANLGSYEIFLMALTIAGILQIIGGALRAGFIANFVPTTVIQGLLAAIGILIIAKQIPLALGYTAEAGKLSSILKEAEENLTLAPLLSVFKHLNIGAVLITIASLITLVLWEKLFPKLAKMLPAAVVVVVVAVVINQLLDSAGSALALERPHLVDVPVNKSIAHFLSQFKHPDFSSLTNVNVYLYAFMIAMVASLESLLNLEAVERIDKQHRYSSRNRELVAQGCGNVLSGLLGGLPITSVIVRSSVNISAGANSKLSAILHGCFLLLSITFIAEWLNYIPLPALAAILIHTGYKLAKPSLFKSVYSEGMRYFIPFMITVIAIVVTNLLLGIIIGLCASILFILHGNSKNGFISTDERHTSGEILHLILPQQANFLSKAAIIEELNNIPDGSRVIIDANTSKYIDNDILNVIKEFNTIQAADKNILLNLTGFKQYGELDNQINFIAATTQDVQMALTPDLILKILIDGNKRFVDEKPIHKEYKQQITTTAASQHPIAVVLGCIDSRVPIELVFDLSFGDVFAVRVAGNVVNDDILGSIEYACKIAGAKLIVVLGHKKCGAIAAACDNFQLSYITSLVEKIKPAIEQEKETIHDRTGANETFVNNVVNNNVELVKQHLYNDSPILRALIDNKEVKLVGAVYDLHNGVVNFEEHTDTFNKSKEDLATVV